MNLICVIKGHTKPVWILRFGPGASEHQTLGCARCRSQIPLTPDEYYALGSYPVESLEESEC